MKILRFAVLSLLSLCAYCQIVMDTKELTVKIGRSVYLKRDDIRFTVTEKGDECRVEVVRNDPITQRVGFVEPHIFDCDFPPSTVEYFHSGSPLLSEDQIKFRAYKFTKYSTLIENFYVNVRILNSTNDLVRTRGLRSVVVPEAKAISNTIDSTVLGFNIKHFPNTSCSVSFSRHRTVWPIAGQLIMGNSRDPVDTFKKSCHEFLLSQLHYQHLKPHSPDVDYIPLKIEHYDSLTSNEPNIENFFLPVYIKDVQPNFPPTSSHRSLYMMDVDEFVLSSIIPGVIFAEDYETPNSKLVYNISHPPGENEGYFVNLDDHTTPITSFQQTDIENERIAYQPPGVSYLEQRIYKVGFTVFDSHFSHSQSIFLHIAVRSSATSAPKVSKNSGLIILEGQSRTITQDNLRIVDRNNLNKVRLYVTGGLLHGRIEVNSKQSLYFSVEDLQRKSVVYIHDDSETTKDRIDLRISDGVNTVLTNFPITVIPRDDSSPYVVNNMGLELNKGGIKQLNTDILKAHDVDTVDTNIIFVIVHPPEAGEILRRVHVAETGTRVTRFSQHDLRRGAIYYRHFGREMFIDSFQFRLRDQHEPPNKSNVETFHITINQVNENPPELSPDATRLMHVLENDIAYITKAELQYTDKETDDNQLTYIITAPPYFVSNRGNEDAGRLIATHNMSMVSKDQSQKEIRTFKQEDINHMKIAYMPPLTDIGPGARLVRFVYTVQDASGNRVLGQYFDIDVQPVNDKAPTFVTSKLLVEEGGILGITTDHLSATDVDTRSNDLFFIVEATPSFGVLQKAGDIMKVDSTFNSKDLKKKRIRYVNDGSDVVLDTFTLSLSDGINRATKVMTVDIVPLDDESPQLGKNLRPRLIVSEGSEALITSSVLSATDVDTDDKKLVFLIIKQPKHGVMQLNNRPATKFTQKNVKDEIVKYIHTAGEIGTAIMKDSVTFIVSDQNYLATADLPVYDLNITITPIDNSKPTIITGREVSVKEGGSITLTPDIITAKDPDTAPEEIQFMIVRQPQWGYIENIKPTPGSEKPNRGIRIATFRLQDIIDNSVKYVQATHKGVEPVYDDLEVYATDGNHRSPVKMFGIRILPQNDEEPTVMLHDFSLNEGDSMMMDKSMVDAVDMDMPKDKLNFAISQPPEHGNIVAMIRTRRGDVEAEIQDFSLEELHSGLRLKYKHDNTENFHDRFAVTVSDGRHEVKRLCNISVNPLNDERPEITKNAGLQLEYGDYAMISSVVLQSTDPDNSENEVYYIVTSVPTKGSLQFCSDPYIPARISECKDLPVGSNFTQYEINMNRIRYVHTRRMGNSETDSFRFLLSDGRNKRHIETFEIRIRNSQKANLALLNKGLEVREGERTPITSSNLSASDESTKPEEIVFAIIKPPKHGQIENVYKPLLSITSFTQLDIASQKIVYNHLKKGEKTKDSFSFTVTNGLSQAKDGVFQIEIEPLDRILPSLKAHSLIEVSQGSDIVLNSGHLLAEDPDTPSMNVTYLLAKSPTYGHLYKGGLVETKSFTQRDIDLGYMTYESDISFTGLDNFLFSISDGRHTGFLLNDTLQTNPVICSIFINPTVNDAPKLIVNNPPETLEYFGQNKYGFRLSSRNLKAVDSDTDNSRLMYIIVKRPMFGHIQNVATKRFVRRRFTQKDLDENSLLYVLTNNKESSVRDSFIFKVLDSRGNSLNEIKFQVSWSIIEFEKKDLVVCENVGTLSVKLRRKGALDNLAFVRVSIKEMSATEGVDFVPSTAEQVQFNPGQAQAVWDVRIPDDGLLEVNEKFRIVLEEPVNAILGEKDRVTVRIINAESGECPQYLGMISKDQTELVDIDDLLLPANGNTDTFIKRPSSHLFKSGNPIDNTYNTEPGKKSIPKAPSSDDANINKTSDVNAAKRKRSKKRGRKNRKRKRNGKKRRRNKKKKRKKLPPVVNIQAPQECTSTTKGLLHFDMYSQQMYICDSGQWKKWTSDSKEEQQADSRSDTELCNQGTHFDGRCYTFVNERLTWNAAQYKCEAKSSMKSTVTSVRSKEHFDFLVNLAKKKSFWIGLTNKEKPMAWKYLNNEPYGDGTFANWGRKQPNTRGRNVNKHCVQVGKNQTWRNKRCDTTTKRFICEGIPNTKSIKTKRSRSRRRHKYSRFF
ncbi:FRAS1-related extracellular matrix protein 1-like [Mytilus edulis]|uniref:FRAS1-related extracellular matrix protein 1-like n=1 Tax=Mytilus edulis TaxID=6550 RepID=UPI0039F111FD